MNHSASSRFWTAYQVLPEDIRSLANKNFQLLNPIRVILPCTSSALERCALHESVIIVALGFDVQDRIKWFWIGTHADYDKMIAP